MARLGVGAGVTTKVVILLLLLLLLAAPRNIFLPGEVKAVQSNGPENIPTSELRMTNELSQVLVFNNIN